MQICGFKQIQLQSIHSSCPLHYFFCRLYCCVELLARNAVNVANCDDEVQNACK